MNLDAQQALLQELQPREHLLWYGIPIQGVYFRKSDGLMIQSGIFGRSTKSLSLTNLPEIVLTQKPDGRGIISFGQDRRYGESTYTAPKFEMIEHVREVHQLIFDARQKVLSGSAAVNR